MSAAPKLTTVANVSGWSGQAWSKPTRCVRVVAPFTLLVAIVAVVTDPSGSAVDLFLAAFAVAAFAVWAFVPRVPMWALTLAVICPVVIAQRDGHLEPLMFEVSVLALHRRPLGVVASGRDRPGPSRRGRAGGGEPAPGSR